MDDEPTMMQSLAAAQAVPDPEEEVLEIDDLYDSELIAIGQVYAELGKSVHARREMGAFQREVRERFEDIGIVARCDYYQSRYEDHLPKSERTNLPTITLVRRIEKAPEFDHEQMGHEVRSDILGVNKHGNVQDIQVAPGFERKT